MIVSPASLTTSTSKSSSPMPCSGLLTSGTWSQQSSQATDLTFNNVVLCRVYISNEVYLQLIKQTTKNPRISSTVKGWELITFCLASFPPTKKLSSFLISTCRSAINESENAAIKVSIVIVRRLPFVLLYNLLTC